jgi:RimJ/RimL family protein N-acetyltransferase
MDSTQLSVREIQKDDFEKIVSYFLDADDAFLLGMGVDRKKLPTRDEWLNLLEDEYQKPIAEKKFYYIIWKLKNTPIGHSNINKIIYEKEAYMHLHMWRMDKRQKGLGRELVRMSMKYYFDKFELKQLFCEPYALNHAPNKTLEKLGFELIEQYETSPGWISFHQPVKKWRMTADQYFSFYDRNKP